MILIVITALFVLGIALFQAVQGLFSALIMSILTILCAVLAFNFYEPLAEAVSLRRRMRSCWWRCSLSRCLSCASAATSSWAEMSS